MYKTIFLASLFTFLWPIMGRAQKCPPPDWANLTDNSPNAQPGWIIRIGVGASNQISLVNQKAHNNATEKIAFSIKQRVKAYNEEVVVGTNDLDITTFDAVTNISSDEVLTNLKILATTGPCLMEDGKYQEWVMVGYHFDRYYLDRLQVYEIKVSPRRHKPMANPKRLNTAPSTTNKPPLSRKPTSKPPKPKVREVPERRTSQPSCSSYQPTCSPKGQQLQREVPKQPQRIKLEGPNLVPFTR